MGVLGVGEGMRVDDVGAPVDITPIQEDLVGVVVGIERGG